MLARTTRWLAAAALMAAIAAPAAAAHHMRPPEPTSKMTLVQLGRWQTKVIRHDRRVLRQTRWLTKVPMKPWIAQLVFFKPIQTRFFHYEQLRWMLRERAETNAKIRARWRAKYHTSRTTSSRSGGRAMSVEATCYDLGGHTANGSPVGWGSIATDPTVIPTGTHLYVPGYGSGVANDTGGAIKGYKIDVWMPTGSQCAAWGRRTVTITVH